ncbi:hypothetical protein BaRGS_00018460 [Batillaria attramentaria]|uniref:Uncharacterized protein n=1 Tax=Batillaria attramentaria TaxID=370345 RepID=A0ABD0KTQ6_9CAEN
MVLGHSTQQPHSNGQSFSFTQQVNPELHKEETRETHLPRDLTQERRPPQHIFKSRQWDTRACTVHAMRRPPAMTHLPCETDIDKRHSYSSDGLTNTP